MYEGPRISLAAPDVEIPRHDPADILGFGGTKIEIFVPGIFIAGTVSTGKQRKQ